MDPVAKMIDETEQKLSVDEEVADLKRRAEAFVEVAKAGRLREASVPPLVETAILLAYKAEMMTSDAISKIVFAQQIEAVIRLKTIHEALVILAGLVLHQEGYSDAAITQFSQTLMQEAMDKKKGVKQ